MNIPKEAEIMKRKLSPDTVYGIVYTAALAAIIIGWNIASLILL